MSVTPPPPRRFRRDALNTRARWRLLGGLALLFVSLAYGTWAARRLAMPGGEDTAVDRPLVHVATRLNAPLQVRVEGEPKTDDEYYLRVLVRDQADVMLAMTVLILRLGIAGACAGFGLVLLTAGSTEWELRSESANQPPALA